MDVLRDLHVDSRGSAIAQGVVHAVPDGGEHAAGLAERKVVGIFYSQLSFGGIFALDESVVEIPLTMFSRCLPVFPTFS